MKNEEILHIKFDGTQLESGTIDAYDFATTVLATADALRAVANKVPSAKNAQLKIDVKALRPGSFYTDLIVSFRDVGIALAPLINTVTFASVKEVISTLRGVIELKKFLKGEKPTKVETTMDGNSGTATVYNFSGDKMVVNLNVYGAMSDKQVSSAVTKVFEPISKEGSEVELIKLSTTQDSKELAVQVTKEEVAFMNNDEGVQTVEVYKARGVVSAIDRKTYNGKINIGDDKRVNFEVEIIDIARLDPVINALIDSMRAKIPIIIIGEAVFDLELNIKKIKVQDVENDSNLFE